MRLAAVRLGTVLALAISLTGVAAAADDPFAWLEDVEGGRALAWVTAQNNLTGKTLKTDPGYAAAEAAALDILTAPDRIANPSLAGGQVFNLWQDQRRDYGLWRRTSFAAYQRSDADWETLLDLDALNAAQNDTLVWKGAQCLPPAFYRCLVKLSRAGRDAVSVREFDVPSRRFVPGGFDVAEAKTEIAWVDANTVLVATNWGPNTVTRSGYPRTVRIWRRGQPIAQARTIYQGETGDILVAPRTAFDAKGKALRFIVRGLGRFGAELFHVDDAWRVTRIAVPTFAEFRGVHQGQLLLLLLRDWQTAGRVYLQGSLVSLSLDGYLASGGALPPLSSLYTPDAKTALASVASARDAVYLSLLENVKGRLYEVTLDGTTWRRRLVPLPDNGAIEIASAGEADSEVLVKFSGFLAPDRLYLLAHGAEPRMIRHLPALFDADDIEVTQHEATSADGTRIPYFLVRNEDAPNNGSTPTLLYAYGGFQVSTTPWYWASAGKLWLEKGGAYAVANVRGGGEFGPRWHEAARGINRQRNFDDLAAVAKDLIARGMTSPRRLGVLGASQGGLLATGTAMQNPALFTAAVAQVPLTDMLRYPQLSAGASWLAEYGDPADPRQRAAILRWSPYHNVMAGEKYPRIFFLGATRDDRVHPAHARKIAAKFQATGHPYLFFETLDAGHDATRSPRQRAEQLALTFTYLRQQLMD